MVAPVTEVIGQSENGADMTVYKFDVLNPIYKLYVQARIHGDEDEGEDAANLFITDISSTSAPPYYANISIHVLVPANPDGKLANVRENTNGLDLNRDVEIVQSKEVLNVHKYIRKFKPNVVIDVHNFPPSQSELTPLDLKFDHDMMLDYPTNPICRRGLTDGQYQELLALIKSENSLYKYDRYINPGNTDTRFSTEDIVDHRQGLAFRYDILGFIFEGREPRADESSTAQKNRTRQAQFGALKTTTIWLRNNPSIFMGTLTNPALRAPYGIRTRYNTTNADYTLDMYHISTDTVAPYTFHNFKTDNTLYVFTSFPLGYAIHEDNQKNLVSHLKNKLGYTYTSGTGSDRYDIETIHIDAADAWDDADGVLADQDMPANVEVTYKRGTKSGFSNYKLFFTKNEGGYQLPFYLEPKAEFALARYRDLMNLPIKKGTNYAILRLMKKR